MISLQRKQSGFTIVELLIVIVVIGILAALVVTTFSGVQRKARNTERETDIKAVHGQLEAYFADLGEGSYPQLAELNSATWRSTNMKGLDEGALKDPKGTASTFAAASTGTTYGYVPTPNTCTTALKDCVAYTLTATLEGGGTYTKASLN